MRFVWWSCGVSETGRKTRRSVQGKLRNKLAFGTKEGNTLQLSRNLHEDMKNSEQGRM